MRTSAKPRGATDGGTRRARGKAGVSGATGAPKGERPPVNLVLTKAQIIEMAERSAKSMLGVSSKQAFKMLDGGALNGTVAEVEFKMLRHLLGR